VFIRVKFCAGGARPAKYKPPAPVKYGLESDTLGTPEVIARFTVMTVAAPGGPGVTVSVPL
jgi:hypothetical protein